MRLPEPILATNPALIRSRQRLQGCLAVGAKSAEGLQHSLQCSFAAMIYPVHVGSRFWPRTARAITQSRPMPNPLPVVGMVRRRATAMNGL